MFTLSQLAEMLGCTYNGDPDYVIQGAASITSAKSGDIVFVLSEKYLASLEGSKAGAVIVTSALVDKIERNMLVCNNPHVAFAGLLNMLHPAQQIIGVSKSADIDDSALLGKDVFVGPNTSIGAGTTVANLASIGSNVVLGNNVRLGERTIVESGAVILDDTRIGSDCIIHAGAVIGADGFGYAKSAERWIKVAQIGRVIIGDEVEIGANTTIDRGALDDTCIGNRVKIDNQVQVGHNTVIDEDAIIAGCVGIAGSTRIGARCAIGGQVGIMGHLEICDDVTVGACSTVSKSITSPGTYSSSMRVDEISVWQKNMARFNRLDLHAAKLNSIEKRLNALEGDG